MPVDFGIQKPKKLETARYTMWNVQCKGSDKEVVLIVKEAGESNKPYFNERLRMAEHLQKKKARMDDKLVAASRARDYNLFPQHVVVGWENVLDTTGAPVPFSEENVKKFLKDCGDDEFDDLREYCSSRGNFSEQLDVASAAGN